MQSAQSQLNSSSITRAVCRILAAALLVGSASPAFADGGTALMYVGFWHLTIGNFVIGVIEGLIIWRVFKTRADRAIVFMIPANYASALLGYLAVLCFLGYYGHATENGDPLRMARQFVLIGMIATYPCTILIEWPFCFKALEQRPHRWRTAFAASVLVQTVSYFLLGIFYLWASQFSLLTNTIEKPDLKFVQNPKAWVYFLATDESALYRQRLDGSRRERFMPMKAYDRWDRLFVGQSPRGTRFDLCIATSGASPERASIAIKDFASTRTLAESEVSVQTGSGELGAETGLPDFYNGVPDMRPKNDRIIEVFAEPLPGGALRVYDRARNTEQMYALENPFADWAISNVTVLRGDEVLFQAEDHLMILNLRTHEIGVLGKGQGPVVILDENLIPPRPNAGDSKPEG